MHDYLSKTKSSEFHYFVLPIGTVRGKPLTASGRPTKSDISTLIQYTTLWRGQEARASDDPRGTPAAWGGAVERPDDDFNRSARVVK